MEDFEIRNNCINDNTKGFTKGYNEEIDYAIRPLCLMGMENYKTSTSCLAPEDPPFCALKAAYLSLLL